MRIAIIEPYRLSLGMGNSISAERLCRTLLSLGVQVRKISLMEVSRTDAFLVLTRFKPNLLHGYHALRTGPFVRRWAKQLQVPYVISLRGTDVYVYLDQKEAGRAVTSVLKSARYVVALHEGMEQAVLKRIPALAERMAVIPHGVWLPRKRLSRRLSFFFSENSKRFIFLVLGNIRSVKDPLFPLALMHRLHRLHPELLLVYAGAVMEASFGKTFLKSIREFPWLHYPGVIPHRFVYEVLKKVHVVVNTSRAEGMSNTLLEAMACGKPVLARNIPGNASIIRDHVNGCLFKTKDDFYYCAKRMMEDEGYRKGMGERAKMTTAHRFSRIKEAKAYKNLYLESLTK